MDISGSCISFECHFSLRSDDVNSSFDDESQLGIFQSIVKELTMHSIDQTEYTLLKLIVIFNARKFN